ncbi:MAG: hypothetical protein ACFFAS_09180 [Promethearchaeota archaeon]
MERKQELIVSVSVGVLLIFIGNLSSLGAGDVISSFISVVIGFILSNVGFWWFIIIFPLILYMPEIVAYASSRNKGK